MIKQLIERFEKLQKDAEPVAYDTLNDVIEEAKQLQAKVRCENCKSWGTSLPPNCETTVLLKDHGVCVEMIVLYKGKRIGICQHKNNYCQDWEEKE